MKSKDYTTFALARLAGCADPDVPEGRTDDLGNAITPSAGAKFLRYIADGVEERDDYADDDGDAAHEIADGAISDYTHEKWVTFVDLAAYSEDASELGYEYDPNAPEKLADTCLYLIGRRLADTLMREASEQDDDDE